MAAWMRGNVLSWGCSKLNLLPLNEGMWVVGSLKPVVLLKVRTLTNKLGLCWRKRDAGGKMRWAVEFEEYALMASQECVSSCTSSDQGPSGPASSL